MNYYLLAYPRSGSSLVRVLISTITGMRPLQPDGSCELNSIAKSTEKNHKFFKFHHPIDVIPLPQEPKNTLILLTRNPIENIPSYIFSDRHQRIDINQTEFDTAYYVEFFQKIGQHVWNHFIEQYQQNLKFYKQWKNQKLQLSYEKIITNPQSLLEDLKGLPRSGEPIDFDKIFDQVLRFKTAKHDRYKVITAGQNLKFFEPLIPKNIRELLESILCHQHSDSTTPI